MRKNILDHLEEQVKANPNKIVFEENNRKITYKQFQKTAK